MHRALGSLWSGTKRSNIHLIRVLEREGKRARLEKCIKKLSLKLPKLVKRYNPTDLIHEAKPRLDNPKEILIHGKIT